MFMDGKEGEGGGGGGGGGGQGQRHEQQQRMGGGGDAPSDNLHRRPQAAASAQPPRPPLAPQPRHSAGHTSDTATKHKSFLNHDKSCHKHTHTEFFLAGIM